MRVKPKDDSLEAMKFTHDNFDEFWEWAQRHFGVSGYSKSNEPGWTYIWLGRRGDDHDVKVKPGSYVVVGPYGPRVYSEQQFAEQFEVVG